MKALIRTRYGSPDALMLREVETPIPKRGEVLVRIHASSINAYDWRMLMGKPLLVCLREGLRKPKNTRLGADVAGVVEAVDGDVQNIEVGDAVYGCLADGNGDCAYAEYACAKQDILAPIPEGISFEAAATLPMAAMTALQGLRNEGQIQAGQRVLINGASGGVGTFAVQIAKALGGEVTGVCSTRNMEMVSRIGADYVLDYTKEDFTQNGKQYDLILDNVANHTLSEYRRALRPNGRCVVVGFSTVAHTMKVMLFGGCGSKENKRITALAADNTKQEDLLFLNMLLEENKITPVIDGSYSLNEACKAFWYFQQEHAKGKVVIRIP